MRSTFVALLVLVAAGCGREHSGGSDAKGSDVVARLDDHLMLTAPVNVGNLTVWPVLTDKPLDLGEFLTLDEALAKGAAEVREAGTVLPAPQDPGAERVDGRDPTGRQVAVQTDESSEQAEGVRPEELSQQTLDQLTQVLDDGAVVNTLVIENKGDLPILVCAGTVVKGGKQDRQIAQDFVLKANSTTPVDAFCVEQGRWQSVRLGQETDGKFEVLEGMATARVRAKGQYEKDQGGVWQEVRNVRASFNTSVAPERAADETVAGDEEVFALVGQPIVRASSSYAVAFDANAAASAEDLKRCEDAVTGHFGAHAGAVGFAYAINGKPVAVRTFAHPRLLAKHLSDFVRGMATEALLAKSDEPAKQASADDVVALVKRISAADEQVEETSGVNRNGKRMNEIGYNGTCYVADKEGRLAPLTQDWTAR